jgi:hypothetical protein
MKLNWKLNDYISFTEISSILVLMSFKFNGSFLRSEMNFHYTQTQPQLCASELQF